MTSDTITPFLWEGEIAVRIIERDGALWFVAVDVCRILGIANARDAVGALDDDEKGVGTTDTLGGKQGVVVVSESGLYSLIFKSRKPDARKFRRWVTGEVLPALRRTAQYVLPASGSIAVSRRYPPKPFDQWTLEERKVALAHVNAARHTLSQAAAVWTWGHLGLPIPPRHLLPAWWQSEMVLGAEPAAGIGTS